MPPAACFGRVIVLLLDMPQPNPAHNRIGFCHAPQGEDRDNPEGYSRYRGNSGQTPDPDQQGDQGRGHNRLAFRAHDMSVTVQGLMNRQGAVHITAPEKENTELTMDAAKAMKEIPNTTDSSSLKPPLMSSLFIMKMTPQRAIATMEIHFPAGPVTVFTTCSRGLENSVMPPEAKANPGKSGRQAKRPKKTKLLLRRRLSGYMTISLEAVMRRNVGARGPQNMSGFTTGAGNGYFTRFHAPFSQKSTAVAATNFFFLIHTFLTL
jgi:hypothetical protein